MKTDPENPRLLVVSTELGRAFTSVPPRDKKLIRDVKLHYTACHVTTNFGFRQDRLQHERV